jgi:hypothetical protein
VVEYDTFLERRNIMNNTALIPANIKKKETNFEYLRSHCDTLSYQDKVNEVRMAEALIRTEVVGGVEVYLTPSGDAFDSNVPYAAQDATYSTLVWLREPCEE